MSTRDGHERGEIGQQAANWLLANQAGPLSDSQRAEFLAWLRTSPLHVEEYLEVAELARALPEAVSDPTLDVEELVAEARDAPFAEVVAFPESPGPAAADGRRRSSFGTRALAASFLVAVIGASAAVAAWLNRDDWLGLEHAYATAHGQRTRVELPDGSTLQLNAESAATVRYDLSERRVVLTHGEALFEVVHSARRAFRVTAGDARVLAVGTRFDVLVNSGRSTVTVVEGTVLVSSAGAGTAPASLTVTAGQKIEVRQGVLAPHAAIADLASAQSWLQGQISVESVPLADVAERFNAYAPVRFEIEGEALRQQPISGNFNADDYESFAAFLAALDGVTLDRQPGRIIVRQTPPAEAEPGPAPAPSPR